MDKLQILAQTVIQWSALLFLFVIGIFALVLVILFVIDSVQTKHTIRRNYPVVGRFRYIFEHLGEFFRQYFFAMDREELPFNRADRSWVYRAAKQMGNNIPFGSTRSLDTPGEPIFLNSAFPVLEEDIAEALPVTIGAESCALPYTTNAIINISGMSYGSISKPAVQALSYGARIAGIWLNSGEGGVSSYHLEGGADIVFQIGTANYGVRTASGTLSDSALKHVAQNPQIKMFEIKLSQGAKPGKGGILPAEKVTQDIAQIRGIPIGKSSISPNRHQDIESIDDLLDKIEHVRHITGKPTGIKFVIGHPSFLHDLCRGIQKRGVQSAPDFLTIDSADGGSGAAPQPLMDYVGMALYETLPLTVDCLIQHNLRQRIKVIASGRLISPGRVAWALATGADFVVSARGFMFALGCIQALQCHKNSCPTGITTHKESLQRGLVSRKKSIRIANYAKEIMYGVGLIAHACGVKEPRALERKHVRIIQKNGLSVSMDELYPTIQ